MNRVEIAVVLVATSLHGAGLLVARSLPELHHLEKAMTPAMTVEFDTRDIELPKVHVRPPVVPKPDQPQPIAERDEESQGATDPHVDVNRANHRGGRSSESSGGPEGSGDSTGPGPQLTTDDGSGEYSAPGEDSEGPGPPGQPPGISSLTQRIAIAGAKAPAAETKAPKAKKADRRIADVIIKDELRKKDKGLGLDLPAAGTVASIIKSAVIGSDAQGDAACTFQVVLGPGGKVVSVTAGAQRGAPKSTWDGIAAMVKGALKSQSLTLTEDYAKGAIIVVNVVSKIKMPSGANVGDGLKLSLTQNFDVADIGAKPVRVVVAPFTVTPVQ